MTNDFFNDYDKWTIYHIMHNIVSKVDLYEYRKGVLEILEEPKKTYDFSPVSFILKSTTRKQAEKEADRIYKQILKVLNELFIIESEEKKILANPYQKGYVLQMRVLMQAKLIKEMF